MFCKKFLNGVWRSSNIIDKPYANELAKWMSVDGERIPETLYRWVECFQYCWPIGGHWQWEWSWGGAWWWWCCVCVWGGCARACACVCFYPYILVLRAGKPLSRNCFSLWFIDQFSEYLPRLSQASLIFLSCKEASELTWSFSYNFLELQVLHLLRVSPSIYPPSIDLHPTSTTEVQSCEENEILFSSLR